MQRNIIVRHATARYAMALQLLLLMFVLAAVTPTTLRAQSSLPADALTAFDSTVARKHLEYLASDAMRGRNTPSPELTKASHYIADAFDALQLEKVSDTRFADYTIFVQDLSLPTSLTFVRGADTLRCEPTTDFVPFEYTGEGTFSNARIVAAGFGITAPEYNYDDYKGLNVEGAVVLVIRGEPSVQDSAKGFRGRNQTRHASSREKVSNARKHGAAAVLIVDSPTYGKVFVPRGHSWPALAQASGIRMAEPSISMPHAPRTVPALHVGSRIVSWLFDSLPGFIDYALAIDSTVVTNSRVLEGVSVTCRVVLKTDSVKVPNVVGMIRGCEIPNEYVVVGAHFDHVGVDHSGKHADSIYNGADDNASGVAGMLLAASALSTSDQKPKRSVVFIAFSGEEKGLFGSEAYVASPLLPLDKCVAMVNMDMIGRCANNKLSIGGNARCPDLASMNEMENAHSAHPFAMSYDIEPYFFRSDQANFAKKQIPVIFYFTGEHGDYHQVGDEVQKINFGGLTDIARIATGVVWQAASQPRTVYIDKP